MVQHLSLNRKHTVSINNFIPKSRCVSISDDRIYSASLDNRIARLQHRIKNNRKNKKTQKYSPYRCTTVSAWDRKSQVVDSGFLKNLKCSWCFAVLICCCCCYFRRLTEKERARVGWHSQSAERVLRRAQKVAVQSPQLTKENVNFFQSASSKRRIDFGISMDSLIFSFTGPLEWTPQGITLATQAIIGKFLFCLLLELEPMFRISCETNSHPLHSSSFIVAVKPRPILLFVRTWHSSYCVFVSFAPCIFLFSPLISASVIYVSLSVLLSCWDWDGSDAISE